MFIASVIHILFVGTLFKASTAVYMERIWRNRQVIIIGLSGTGNVTVLEYPVSVGINDMAMWTL